MTCVHCDANIYILVTQFTFLFLVLCSVLVFLHYLLLITFSTDLQQFTLKFLQGYIYIYVFFRDANVFTLVTQLTYLFLALCSVFAFFNIFCSSISAQIFNSLFLCFSMGIYGSYSTTIFFYKMFHTYTAVQFL